MKIKNSLKLSPYYALNDDWTKIANTMFKYIDDLASFKVYCYLCYRYNNKYQYAFPSIETIASDCNISKNTVYKAVKYLEERSFIVKYKKENSEWMNNCYYVRYVVETNEDVEKEQKQIVEAFEEMIGENFEIEVEIIIDENEKIVKKNFKNK